MTLLVSCQLVFKNSTICVKVGMNNKDLINMIILPTILRRV